MNNVLAAYKQFIQDRDWDQFHTPKNLASAVSIEAAELQEHFLWLTPEQSQQLSKTALIEVQAECADVFLYLLTLADKLGIDLLAAAWNKLESNAVKYPADRCKGKADKWTVYQQALKQG